MPKHTYVQLCRSHQRTSLDAVDFALLRRDLRVYHNVTCIKDAHSKRKSYAIVAKPFILGLLHLSLVRHISSAYVMGLCLLKNE